MQVILPNNTYKMHLLRVSHTSHATQRQHYAAHRRLTCTAMWRGEKAYMTKPCPSAADTQTYLIITLAACMPCSRLTGKSCKSWDVRISATDSHESHPEPTTRAREASPAQTARPTRPAQDGDGGARLARPPQTPDTPVASPSSAAPPSSRRPARRPSGPAALLPRRRP